MKLLKLEACHWASDGGNVKIMTVMGDASMEGLSDRGSIPLRSTEKPQLMLRFYLHMFESSDIIFFNRGKQKKGYQDKWIR